MLLLHVVNGTMKQHRPCCSLWYSPELIFKSEREIIANQTHQFMVQQLCTNSIIHTISTYIVRSSKNGAKPMNMKIK